MTICMYNKGICLVWDSSKNERNLVKHGFDFQDALYVFAGETITFIDNRQHYGEVRYTTLGFLKQSKAKQREVVIAHTLRDECLCVISMRKANEREQKIFKKRLESHRQNERSRH